MDDKVKTLLEELITKAEVLKLVIQKDPAALSTRAYMDTCDALTSLKMVRVEMCNEN